MEHSNHSPESARPNRRQFLLTTGSTLAAGVIARSGRLINEFTSPQPYKKESKYISQFTIIMMMVVESRQTSGSGGFRALQQVAGAADDFRQTID
jgi:hypothetical protein